MTDAPQPQSAFRAILGNRLVQVLAAIAALIAIVGEGAIVYTNIQKAQTEAETARNAQERQKAEAAIATQKAEIELQAARNAEILKRAEAQKMQAEAEIARINIAKAKSDADKAASGAAILRPLVPRPGETQSDYTQRDYNRMMKNLGLQ
jgi:hypothetical protein